MENVNLHELPRKELKQLCNEHNIRTAGVKHEDLVRLLRNKLYPPAPDPSRLSKARSLTGSQTSIDSRTSSKNRVEPDEKTPTRTTSQGRTQRSLVFVDDPSRDIALERNKRELSPNPALIRKPVLTKSNLTPARRSDFLRKKVNTLSGLDKQSLEGQPRQSDGSPSMGRNVVGGRRSSIRSTSMVANRPGEGLNAKVNGAQKPQADVHSEAASSPRTSEGGASVAAADSSDTGSPSFRSVSEIASEAGHHPVSEDSDFDDARSVLSEPVTRFTSQTSKLAPRTSIGSKLGRTVFSSWNSENERDSLESPARSNNFHEQDSEVSAAPGGDDIFSYFLETGDTLVGDTDGLDSFLDIHTADPEDIKSADGREVDSEQFRTPETFTEHHQVIDIVDRKESMREEDANSNNSEAALTDGLPESLPGDRWLVDYETALVSERAGVVDSYAALPSADAEARAESINSSSNGSLSVENPHGVENGDKDIAPQSIESPGHSLEDESTTAPVTISELGRSADPEDVSITSDSTAHILDDRVEQIEVIEHAIVEDPEDLPGIEISFRDDGLCRSGKEISSETSDALSDSAHVEEEENDSRGSEVTCNNRSFDEVVAGEEIPESNEDHSEMPVVSTEISEHAQAGTPPVILFSEENDTVEDSSEHERLRVVVTTSDLDSPSDSLLQIASLGDIEDRHSVGDTSCVTPDSIPDAECIPSEPVEDRGDVKWSFVSALYDESVDHVDNTDNTDGYGVSDHLLIAAGELGSGSIRYTEPLKRLEVRECEVANQAGDAAIDTERHGVVDEGNEPANDSNVDQGKDSILNEIARTSVEHAEVEDIFSNGSNGIPVKLGPVLEATGSDHDHEGTRSGSSIPLDIDSSVHHEPEIVLSVSQPCIEPLICSVDKLDGEEPSKSDDLLGSGADDISGANRSDDDSRSVSQIAQEQGGVSFQEEKLSLDPDETSHDDIVATSRPRKLQQIITMGLKMILVIGTVTLGILKIRASKHRFWEKR